MSSRFKSYRQLTPTGTHQDFLLRISSLQAEGKTLASDPHMDDLGPVQGFLAQDVAPWHRGLEVQSHH